MKTIYKKPAEVERAWYLIDAENQPLGKIAVRAAGILRGKNKPFFVPWHALGDHIVIINAAKARLTGRKREQKIYYRHSGYPGGIKAENYEKLLKRHPSAPMEKAVRGMLPKGALGNRIYKNVHIYSGTDHRHQGQNPETIKLDIKESD